MTTATVYTLPATTVSGGMAVDLSRPMTGVDGSRWTWTGTYDNTGMPLVQNGDHGARRLAFVYALHGPLLAEPAPVTAADRYAALTAFTRPGPDAPTPHTVAQLLARLHRRTA